MTLSETETTQVSIFCVPAQQGFGDGRYAVIPGVGTPVYGTVSRANLTFYAIDLAPGGYVADIVPDTAIDLPDMYLVGQNGQYVDAAFASGDPESLSFEVTMAGRYYIGIHGYCGGPTADPIAVANFTLQITGTPTQLLLRGVVPLMQTDTIHFPGIPADGSGLTVSPPLSFTLGNVGSADLLISGIWAEGDAVDVVVDTSEMDAMGWSVAPLESTTFLLSFDPQTIGAKAASVFVQTNDPLVGIREIMVSGLALPQPQNPADTVEHIFQVMTTGDLRVSPRGVIAGNINPDGEMRIIAGSSQNPGVNQGSWMTVFMPAGGGSIWDFMQETELQYSAEQWDRLEPLLAYDFDGDGTDEILAKLNWAPTFIKWNGGTYATTWSGEASMVSLGWGATVADVDRDGAPELIAGTETSTRVYSWIPGFFNFELDATLPGGSSFNVGVGDLDGDGFLEIATSSDGAPDVYVYRFDGSEYQQLYHGTSFASSIGYSGFVAADLDGDHVDELVGGSPNYAASTYYLSMFKWDGAALQEYLLFTGPNAFYEGVAGDFDRDGQTEMLFDQNGGVHVLVEWTGSAVEAVEASIDCYMFMDTRDYDEDGFPELFVNEYGTTGSTLMMRDEAGMPM